MRPLDPAVIDALVHEAMHGPTCLDELISLRLFGSLSAVPELWGEWPPAARESWDEAMRRHAEITHGIEERSRPRRRHQAPTLAEAWAAMLSVAPDPARWWRLPHVTWPMIAPLLDLGTRSAVYYLVQVQGWDLAGLAGSRRIVAAPCVACGTVTSALDLAHRRCPSCR